MDVNSLLKLADKFDSEAKLDLLTPEEKEHFDINFKKGIIHPKNGILYALHDNPMLVLRLINFAAANELDLDKELISACKNHDVHKNLLSNINAKKLWEQIGFKTDEDDKLVPGIFSGPNPSEAADLMSEIGIRDSLFNLTPEEMKEVGLKPEQLLAWDIEPHNSHHELDLWQHALATMKNLTENTKKKIRKDPQLYAARNLAAILHDMGKLYPEINKHQDKSKAKSHKKSDKTYTGHEEISEKFARKILEKLDAPEDVIEIVTRLVKYHMLPHDIVNDESKDKKPKKTLIRKLMEDLPTDIDKEKLLKSLVELSKADAMGGITTTQQKNISKKYDKLEEKLQNKLKKLNDI
jgi:CRISPR/Cas system-associated endonuclease Cas3-HD